MTDQSFDNFFKEKLKDHSAPVPEGLWEKIRPEKEKKPMGFILPKQTGKGLIVAAVITGAIGLALNTGKSKDQQTDAINSPSEPNKTTQSLLIPTATQKDKNTALYTATPSDKQVPNSSTKVETFISNRNPDTYFISSPNTDVSINQVSNTQPIGINNTITTGVENNQSFEDQNASYNSYHPSGNTIGLSNQSRFQQMGMVNKQLSANAHDKKFKAIIICPTVRGKSSTFNTDWAMEVYASPDYAFKSVSNINASAQYLNSKDSSEQMQVGYSAGIRLVKPLNDHFLLKTGLQYSQINQKFVYRNENEIKVTTVITARTIIRSPGDTILVSDTSVLQTIGYSVKNVKNRYRSIDIPLTLGYEFGNDDLRVGINAGVIFNVSSWYQGEMLDTAYQPVSISKASNSLYKTNIGMGLYSSISIQKRISENTHLFFEPYFRYNLKNMTSELSPYTQRFQVGGLAIGLRFNLNR
ncbi:MAG: hypothetical protein B7Y15_12450 [Bacteroidetes bacterium 24-39-8]|nr:MAG: hypothetical protein B7Y15_12450 [Bacteroidetes bacterium 24-39-8]OZA63078.1 MAG: hypothetical protein B7X72_10915 [Sphingobacteriia bacterium 39-39-8]HQR94341.1 outer membrane beta-barrel protein [Sediminibacterium sp.]